MKAHLAKVSLALLSAAFLLGCQEQGSEPVGPEGLGPEFAKVKKCDGSNPHPSCPKEDGQTVTVTLAGGMKGELKFVKVFSDNGKKFSMNTTAESSGIITMNFVKTKTKNNCGEEPLDAEVLTKVGRRKERLVGPVLSLSPDKPGVSLLSLFNVKVDRTADGSPTRGNDLQVTYDDGSGGVILGWAHSDRAAVMETVSENETVFVFSGGKIRVGEEDGKPSDRIRILCVVGSDETVTVTVTK